MSTYNNIAGPALDCTWQLANLPEAERHQCKGLQDTRLHGHCSSCSTHMSRWGPRHQVRGQQYALLQSKALLQPLTAAASSISTTCQHAGALALSRTLCVCSCAALQLHDKPVVESLPCGIHHPGRTCNCSCRATTVQRCCPFTPHGVLFDPMYSLLSMSTRSRHIASCCRPLLLLLPLLPQCLPLACPLPCP
jgi:hypothetical protein